MKISIPTEHEELIVRVSKNNGIYDISSWKWIKIVLKYT